MRREEAISEWTFRSNHIKRWLDEYGEEPSIRHYVELIDMAIEALQTEAVQGEWIDMEILCNPYPPIFCVECSRCGYRVGRETFLENTFNFCPNCGAKNKGGDAE